MIAAFTKPETVFRFSELLADDGVSQPVEVLSDEYLRIHIHCGTETKLTERDLIYICVLCSTVTNPVIINQTGCISESGEVVALFTTDAVELNGGFGIVVSIPFIDYNVLPKGQEEKSESDDNDIQSTVLSRARYGFGGWLYTKILTISNFSTQDPQISDSNLVIVIAEGEGMIDLNDSFVSFSAGDVIRLKKGDTYQLQALGETLTCLMIGVAFPDL